MGAHVRTERVILAKTFLFQAEYRLRAGQVYPTANSITITLSLFKKLKTRMWRQNIFPGDPDSDQSISDEEDFNVDLRDNCVSISENKEKEEGLQLQSRLDILKGTHEVSCGRKFVGLSPKKQTCISLEDEVEMPDFADGGGFISSPRKASTCNLEEEAISDDEENVFLKFSDKPVFKTFHKDGVHNFESAKQDVVNSWFAVSKEAEALVHSNKNAFCSSPHSAYSKANKSCKGIKSKSRTKFSFRFQSCKEGLSWPFVYKDENGVPSKVHEVPERLETIDHRKYSITELLEVFHREKLKQSENLPDEVEEFHRCGEHSVAELLDGLQDSSSLLRRSSKAYNRNRGKRVQVVERSTSPLEDRTIYSENLPEPTESRSSDDEDNDQNLKIAIPDVKRQTIADKFQEALGANSSDKAALVVVPKPSGVGLFGTLQLVMQSEKITDTNFLNSQTRATPKNDRSCIDVKVLSRYLEAKLIVCRVYSGKDIEGNQWPESNQRMVNSRRERTIIFNPRVCCDVDLEVGNSIRIHSPWKEVQVRGNDESIILSTYFSQISTRAVGVLHGGEESLFASRTGSGVDVIT